MGGREGEREKGRKDKPKTVFLRPGGLPVLALILFPFLPISLSPSLPFSLSRAAHADALQEYRNAVGNDSRGEYYTAVLNLRRSLAENANFVPAHLLMGDVFVKLGKFEDADTAYMSAQAQDPHSVEAATRRLKLYAAHLKDFDRAGQFLDETASQFEQNAEIHYYKALVMVGKHSYLNAKDELELALALSEKYFDARKLQLEIEAIIGKTDEIRKTAYDLMADFPDLVESYDLAASHLLKIKTPVEDVLEQFSIAPPEMLHDPAFGRLVARMHLIAERYDKAVDILKNLRTEGLSADAVEDLVYLKTLADIATNRHTAGIQRLADYLRDVPDRPYLQLQLDLWLLRYVPVVDPLRILRAEDRLRTGRQYLADGDLDRAFIHLHLARSLNPRDKNARRHLAEANWQLGLAETAQKEIEIARNLDPHDEFLRKRAAGFGAASSLTDPDKRRVYDLYVFRLSDRHSSLRPGLGRLFTDAVANFSGALTAFQIRALEPAVPFDKAEEVAHQSGADFFLHGKVGLDHDGAFDADFGAFPVGGRHEKGQAALELSEQHVLLKSKSDFTEDLILDTIKSFQRASSEFAMVVSKEREGNMVIDVGRRHGVTTSGRYLRDVQGGPLYFDVINIYEWFTRVRVEEIERARYIGIGDFLRQAKN
ncbi:hypothetical protein HY522_06860 [bacterium]|nr:hypothetical protein [bacterium]